MKKSVVVVVVLSLAVLGGLVERSYGQTPAAPSRGTRSAGRGSTSAGRGTTTKSPTPTAAPAPVQPPTMTSTTSDRPKDGKVTIALIGEDRVADNPNKWQRSQMAAAFEDELVNSKRFRVVSQSALETALKAQRLAMDGAVDPEMAIRIGKIVQAKYVVIVRQIRMQPRQTGFFPKKTILDMELQAQVVNVETTDIAESRSYPRETNLTNVDLNLNSIRSGQAPMDQSKLGPKYSETVKAIAKDFITNAAVVLMPLETVIVDVSPNEAILAAGAKTGLAPGAEFEVMAVTGVVKVANKTIEKTAVAARLRVTRVEDEISYAQFVETYDKGAKDPAPVSDRIKVDMVARFVPIAAAADRK